MFDIVGFGVMVALGWHGLFAMVRFLKLGFWGCYMLGWARGALDADLGWVDFWVVWLGR